MTAPLQHGVAPGKARVTCVFLHGRGQSPEEMVEHVIRHLPVEASFVLPGAAGRSWYAARAIDPLTEVTRAELAAARAQVVGLLAEVRAASNVPVVLAGFSQGACLSLEVACAGQGGAEAVVAFTGCRVGRPEDARPTALPRDLPVYLSGGDADPWIPVAAFAEAVADLGRQGAALRADLFPGRGHEVSAAERAMLTSVLSDLAAGRRPAMEVGR